MLVALLAGPVVAGCSRPEPVAPPAPTVPSFVEPAWLSAGTLDISFTARRWDDGGRPRTSRIHSRLTVEAGGRVTAMRTAQTADGVVASSTEWHEGAPVTSAQVPRCAPATSDATVPPAVAELLATMFGPVGPATTTGWSVEGSTASRPGSTAGVVERVGLTALSERTPREVDSRTSAVLREVTGIRIRHLGGAATADGLPSCGEPAYD